MTGLGLVTPLGVGISRVWKKLLDGKSGIRKIESTDELDYSSLPCQVQSGCSAFNIICIRATLLFMTMCMHNLL